jgi:hypothetical protein
MGRYLWGVRPHATELGHAKNFIVSTHPIRPVQRWAFRCELYCQGNQEHRQTKQRQNDDCQDQVKNALYHITTPVPALRVRWPIQCVGFGIWNGRVSFQAML